MVSRPPCVMEGRPPFTLQMSQNSSAQKEGPVEKRPLSKHLQEQSAQARAPPPPAPPPPPQPGPPGQPSGREENVQQGRPSVNVIRGKTQEPRSKQKPLCICCRCATSGCPSLRPGVLLEERAHSGPWPLLLEPSSSNTAKGGKIGRRGQGLLGGLRAYGEASTHPAVAWLCGLWAGGTALGLHQIIWRLGD